MIQLTQRRLFPQTQWQLEKAGIHPLLARLYAARGIDRPEEVDYALSQLLPPTELLNHDKAALLLADTLEARANIVVVGDYDCDGATGTAVALRALRCFAMCRSNDNPTRVDYLVPSRFVDGYGLSTAIIDAAAHQFNPQLLLTVDNGIAGIESVAHARRLGIQTLITDHHLPGDTLPAADCIVNPNQVGCPFASKNLAGVGVVFYVMLALRAELRRRGWFNGHPEPNLAALLDLVALGTLADVVPLDHNNRILVNQGLQRMRQGKMQPGIAALFNAAQRNAVQATSFDLAFLLAPRLNAAGRLADMSLGIECLLTDDPGRAANIAHELNRINRERREIEAGMLDSAMIRLEQIAVEQAPVAAGIVLFDESWHQGIIGILASRLRERLHCPVLIFAQGDSGEIKGSGRSIPGLHLRDALDRLAKRAPGLIRRFGGHAAAAGLTIAAEDYPLFCRLFADIAHELLTPDDLARTIVTDGALENAYYGLDTIRLINAEVWGQGFPAPLFADRFHVKQQRILKDKHLKMVLEKEKNCFEAIYFNHTGPATAEITAVFRLQINEFNGLQTPQLMIEHLQNEEPTS